MRANKFKIFLRFAVFFTLFLGLFYCFPDKASAEPDPLAVLPISDPQSLPYSVPNPDGTVPGGAENPLSSSSAGPVANPNPSSSSSSSSSSSTSAPAASSQSSAPSNKEADDYGFQTEETSGEATLYWVIGIVLKPVYSISAWILAQAGKLMNFAFGLETFKGIPAVDTSWRVLKDICNMFFIVILMVSGIGTILRLEKYNASKILPQLIFAIFAINFSKTIVYVIVDFTQVLTRTFFGVVGAGTQISEQLGNSMGLGAMFKDTRFWSKTNFAGYGGWVLMHLVLAIVIQVIAAIAIGVGAVMLIERMIWIWILIAVSPMAWGLSVIPDLSGYLKQWWKKLNDKAFFAPYYAFLLAFALLLVRGGQYATPASMTPTEGLTEFFRNPMYLLNYIATILILYFAIGQAKKAGEYTAKVAGYAQGKIKGAGNWAVDRSTMKRTRDALMAEHKARKEMKEGMKKETAKDWAQKYAYRPKDWVQQNSTVAIGNAIRGVARDAGLKFIDEKGKTAKILETRQARETNAERLEKAKEFKDTAPAQGTFKEVFAENKKVSAGEKQALAQYLGDNTGNFDSDPATAYTQFENAINAFGTDQTSRNAFIGKVKKSRVDLVAQYNAKTNSTAVDVEMRKLLSGMGAKDIADQRESVFTQDSGRNVFINTLNSIIAGGRTFQRSDLLRSGASSNKLQYIS